VTTHTSEAIRVERVTFGDVRAFRAKAEALFERLRDRVLRLAPDAIVEHIGSTALPDGCLTKGDLDVQVRIRAEHYDALCAALASELETNPGGFTEYGKSFKDDATDPPFGLHVTVIDAASDVQHRQRERMLADAALRAEYDAIKRAFDGGDMTAYREMKGAFFSRLEGSWDEVLIADYDPAWPASFDEEAARIRRALPTSLAIEHFGSTAVPGLSSKPILDLLVLVPSLDAAPAIDRALGALGYELWRDNPKKDRLFFVQGMPPRGARRTHHVHVSEPNGELVERLVFRDFLRAHRRDRTRYAELKTALASRYRFDRDAYTAGKATFVAAVMAKARKARAVEYRTFTREDSITALTAMLHQAYAPLAARGMRFLASHQDDATTRERVESGETIVAVASGRVVGTVTVRRPGSSDDAKWYARADVASMEQFAVDPDWQGLGIGDALMTRGEAVARSWGVREVAVDTSERAPELVALYERRGYREVERIARDIVNYGSIVMSLRLADR
jgi:GrpB-like predicted nucleotidyltransferase (UPF0157 family)/GNAT superfamily N-acetyltransferase